MGAFEFFRRRRQRESAIPPGELEAANAPSAPPAAGPAASPVEPAERSINVKVGPKTDVAEVVGMVGEALRTGSFQIKQHEARSVEMTGPEMRAGILGALREAGIDPEAGAEAEINAADYAGLQERILGVLAQHGVEAGTGGRSGIDEPDGNRSG